MSGETQVRRRGKKGSGGQNNEGSTAQVQEIRKVRSSSTSDTKSQTGGGGASLITKMIFVLLLTICTILVTLQAVDYRSGQLTELYVNNVPIQIRSNIESGRKFAVQWTGIAVEKIQILWTDISQKALVTMRRVRIGDKTLEELVFGGRMGPTEEEKAALKMKEALEATNKMMKEKEEKERLEKEKREEEQRIKAEKKRKEEQERLKAEQKRQEEERVKAEQRRQEEERIKAEQKRLQEEERKRQEEERLKAEQKRQEEEKKRLEEERIKAEQKRLEEERKKQDEEEKLKAEKKKQEEEKLKAEKQKLEEERKQAEIRKKQEEAEKKIREEERLKSEKVKLEEERVRKQEAKKKEEEAQGRKAKLADAEQKLKQKKEAAAKEAAENIIDRNDGDRIAAKKSGDAKAEEKKKKRPSPKLDEARIKAAKEAGKLAKDMAVTDTDTSSSSNKDDHDKLVESAMTMISKDPDMAKSMFEKIIQQSGNKIPKAIYGKGLALDSLAEKRRSNSLLENAISVYQEAIDHPETDQDLLMEVTKKCIERMEFRGWSDKGVALLRKLVAKYPKELVFQNLLGTQYLIANANKKATLVFENVLSADPSNRYAARHLGFILKTSGDISKLEQAVTLLSQGIADDGSEVDIEREGKFYYHLGQSLARLGRKEEADDVYRRGTEKGLFLSFWQRSLYNVDHLTGRPIWTHEQTGLASKLKMLEENWKVIREEALSLLKAFSPEDENLKDMGKWDQFDIYARGQPGPGCRKAPQTCKLAGMIPEATSNKRGQVKFSVMYPGTHVHAHSGPTNCRLRTHLALLVPPKKADDDGELKIRVADQYLEWEEGKLFVFDDSFDHEVWHFRQGPRVVLILDIWHPDLDEQTKRSLAPI